MIEIRTCSILEQAPWFVIRFIDISRQYLHESSSSRPPGCNQAVVNSYLIRTESPLTLFCLTIWLGTQRLDVYLVSSTVSSYHTLPCPTPFDPSNYNYDKNEGIWFLESPFFVTSVFPSLFQIEVKLKVCRKRPHKLSVAHSSDLWGLYEEWWPAFTYIFARIHRIRTNIGGVWR